MTYDPSPFNADGESRIYVTRDGETYGPYTETQAREYISQGVFTSDDLACPEGGSEWVFISTLLTNNTQGGDFTKPRIAQVATETAPTKPAIQSKDEPISPSPQQQTSTFPLKLFLAVLLAIILGGGVLLFVFLGWSSSVQPKPITGYDTKIVFVGNDGSGNSDFDELTHSGWEIKSSRSAWTRAPYAYSDDEKVWGTEYTLQKPIYENSQ